jgi:hypothetical protein
MQAIIDRNLSVREAPGRRQIDDARKYNSLSHDYAALQHRE